MIRVFLMLVLFAGAARADDKSSVALLPLDAQAKLEVYGHVVASELARALIAGGVEVVVVLPKMAVPEHAKLIVDGKISAGKGKAIELTIRVREPKSVDILKTFPATATSLETLDKTTSELASRVLPMVRDKLDELAKKAVAVADPIKPPVKPIKPIEPQAQPARPLLVGIGTKSTSADVEMFRAALVEVVPGWVSRHHRAASLIEPSMLDAKTATKTVAGSTADRAIAFEILDYAIWGDTVPMATARVRVRIADAGQVLFDRVVTTDTIVGDKAMATDRIAARVATEVLSIMRPHVRKVVPAWP